MCIKAVLQELLNGRCQRSVCQRIVCIKAVLQELLNGRCQRSVCQRIACIKAVLQELLNGRCQRSVCQRIVCIKAVLQELLNGTCQEHEGAQIHMHWSAANMIRAHRLRCSLTRSHFHLLFKVIHELATSRADCTRIDGV